MTTTTVMKTVMGAGVKMNMMKMMKMMKMALPSSGSLSVTLGWGGGAGELTGGVTGAVIPIVLIVTSFNIHDFGGGGGAGVGIWTFSVLLVLFPIESYILIVFIIVDRLF